MQSESKRVRSIRTQPGLCPMSPSTWWVGVRAGRFPQPVKLPGSRRTYWRKRDVMALIGAPIGADGDSLVTLEQITGRRAQKVKP
ncbi:MAG: helix-turn-helix transcriptional regulator [Pseudomonadota bacterium]